LLNQSNKSFPERPTAKARDLEEEAQTGDQQLNSAGQAYETEDGWFQL
jgi:hypothetical protein